MRYTHLSQVERYQIQRLFRAGVSLRWIARLTERNPSTISRELRRNTNGDPYFARRAQQLSDYRRYKASAVPRISLSELRVVEDHLREDWSPEDTRTKGSGLAK